MAYSATDISNAVNEIVNDYTGKTEGYQGGYIGQCTVPVDYYVQLLIGATAPYMANDRADGWGTNFPAELASYFTHNTYAAGTSYPKGTILIWNSPHCAIVLSSNGGTTVDVFEQNADPDGSACHSATRTIDTSTHTCTYALIPIVSEPPAPTPAPAPAPAAPVTAPDTTTQYTIVTTIPGYSTATVAVSKPASDVTVSAGSYYIYNQKYGMVNVTKTPGVPGDWINPSQNVVPTSTPPSPPAAPTYNIVKTLNGYETSNDAANHMGTNTTVPVGLYYVYNQASGMVNVTTIPSTPGDWINPTDNVLSPPTPSTPAPEVVAATAAAVTTNTTSPNLWKSTYVPLDPSPQKYIVVKPYTTVEYGGNAKDIELTVGQEIGIYGTFFYTNNMEYGRPKLATDPNLTLWYGIPIDDGIMEPESVIYSTTTDISTRKVTGSSTLDDKLTFVIAWIKRIVNNLPIIGRK